MSDDKIEPLDKDGQAFGNVIDLAGVRIRSGRSTTRFGEKCGHMRMTYDQSERRVWCEDCNRTVDSFDAFDVLVKHLAEMERAAKDKLYRANEAIQTSIVSLATKALDRVWRGRRMAPCCPHCRVALLPEDFANGVGHSVSREIEIARRRQRKAPPK